MDMAQQPARLLDWLVFLSLIVCGVFIAITGTLWEVTGHKYLALYWASGLVIGALLLLAGLNLVLPRYLLAWANRISQSISLWLPSLKQRAPTEDASRSFVAPWPVLAAGVMLALFGLAFLLGTAHGIASRPDCLWVRCSQVSPF
jgi:energy-converting hydrogenase Eha subunit A